MTTVEVRSYSRNSGRIWWEMESGTARGFSASATASSLFGFANEKRSEIAMDCGCAAEICLCEDAQFLRRRCGEDFSVAGGAFVDAEAEIFGDQRLDAVEEEIVELGAGLASDFDGVFEAGGGDERGARAFAFEQRVGADGGAVEEDEIAFGRDFAGELRRWLARDRRAWKKLSACGGGRLRSRRSR